MAKSESPFKSANPPPKEPFIELYSSKYMKPTWFNRFKTAVWNFILPPHVHLNLPKKESRDGEK